MASALSAADLRALPSRSHLLVFFLVAYGLMWACFFTVASGAVPEYRALSGFLLMLGVFAPSLSALWLTAHSQGATGVRALLGRILRWQAGWQYYVFAVT